MQPHRIAIVQQRAASYAAEHGIDADFLHRLYDLIIDETCRVEDVVIANAAAAG
jgi:4-amino-4-deoxychorismate mutase